MTLTTQPAPAVTDPLPGREKPYDLVAGAARKYLSKGALNKVLATGVETGGEISVTVLQSPEDPDRIPPHFHEPRVHPRDHRTDGAALAQHDFTYCLRGRAQVWIGDQCRIIGPGDVVSIPPGTPHSSQMLSHGTEILAPVFPAGWVRFMEAMGTPYEGAAYPPVDDSPPPPPGTFQEMVAEGLLTPVTDFDYVEVDHDAADDTLPAGATPYVLRGGNGPRHELFGQMTFQLLTGAQSDGRMGVTLTEGPTGASLPTVVHAGTYKAIYCVEGRMVVTVDGVDHELVGGDFISIPKGTAYSYRLGAALTRLVSVVAPAGVERLWEVAGEATEHKIFSEPAAPTTLARLVAAEDELDVKFVEL